MLVKDWWAGQSAATAAGSSRAQAASPEPRRAVVDEAFLHAALTQPARAEVRGYAPVPMLAAVRRLGLAHDPSAVAALAAFIEQIGPETPGR